MSQSQEKARRPRPDEICCSFCAKPKDDVLHMTAGANVFICNECVALCTEIIAMETPGWIDGHAELVNDLKARHGR